MSDPLLIAVGGRAGDVLAGEKTVVVVVELLGAEQEFLEADFLGETRACVAGVPVSDLGV